MTNQTRFTRYYEGDYLAKDYDLYRPGYPSSIKDAILDFVTEQRGSQKQGSKLGRMLDVGCGGGHSTHIFSPDFESILGIDISASQIHQAEVTNRSKNVEFKLVYDSLFPVEDETIDVVACGTAAHFLDIVTFQKECERVLKPGGCVVVYWQIWTDMTVGNKDTGGTLLTFEETTLKFMAECHTSRRLLETYRKRFTPLYRKISNRSKRWVPTPNYEVKFTLPELRALYSTIGEYRQLKKIGTDDPLERLLAKIKAAGKDGEEADDVIARVTFEYPMFVYRKSQKMQA